MTYKSVAFKFRQELVVVSQNVPNLFCNLQTPQKPVT